MLKKKTEVKMALKNVKQECTENHVKRNANHIKNAIHTRLHR